MRQGDFVRVSIPGQDNLLGYYVKRLCTGRYWVVIKMPGQGLESRVVNPDQVRIEAYGQGQLPEEVGWHLDGNGKRG